MKEIPALAEKIRGAGGVKVCYGDEEQLLSAPQQSWIADALVEYERRRYVGERPWIALRDREPAEKVAVEVTDGRYRWDAFLENGTWVPALTYGQPRPTHWREIISLGEDAHG